MQTYASSSKSAEPEGDNNPLTPLLARYETCAVLADSGAYAYRTASLNVSDLPTGRYLLIPSTFETGQEHDFTLRTKTSLPVAQPKFLPAEDSGRFVRVFRGTISAPSPDRMLGQPRSTDNSRYLIRPRQVSLLKIRLRQTLDSGTPLNAAIFPDMPSAASQQRCIGSTGPYASYIAGVTSSPIKLRPSPQGYVLVVSGAALSEADRSKGVMFELAILADHPVDITSMPG